MPTESRGTQAMFPPFWENDLALVSLRWEGLEADVTVNSGLSGSLYRGAERQAVFPGRGFWFSGSFHVH